MRHWEWAHQDVELFVGLEVYHSNRCMIITVGDDSAVSPELLSKTLSESEASTNDPRFRDHDATVDTW